METLKLTFDADFLGEGQTLILEVPYQDGIVATSRFCPKELLNGDVDLLAALNGESLDDFVADCKRQLMGAKLVAEGCSLNEALVSGLTASVMEHQNRIGTLSKKAILLHLDAFAHLLFSQIGSSEKVTTIYRDVYAALSNLNTDESIRTRK